MYYTREYLNRAHREIDTIFRVLFPEHGMAVEAGFMPQINPISVNLADYDVIAIGTPTWWYTMAPAVLTFLTTNDFTGKTVIPFMTNGGWPGHVIKDMEENCKGAAFAHEMQIQFDSKGKDHLETSEEVITEWIGQINTDINK